MIFSLIITAAIALARRDSLSLYRIHRKSILFCRITNNACCVDLLGSGKWFPAPQLMRSVTDAVVVLRLGSKAVKYFIVDMT